MIKVILVIIGIVACFVFVFLVYVMGMVRGYSNLVGKGIKKWTAMDTAIYDSVKTKDLEQFVSTKLRDIKESSEFVGNSKSLEQKELAKIKKRKKLTKKSSKENKK